MRMKFLLLLCKLEALRALPFHEFVLWEYTARVGIDAIASYQIEAGVERCLFCSQQSKWNLTLKNF